MDPDRLLDIANTVTKLKMYPYFEIAHCLITCLYVREDLSAGAILFSRKHPLSCWLSSMLSVFAGGLLANFLLGEPILSAVKDTDQILMATGIWYLVFYSPFDLVYTICKFLPVKIVIATMKEVIRCKKVYDGVLHASKIYPNSYLIMVMIGTIKGSGSGFLKVLERLIRGIWTPTGLEFMQPTFTTKSCILASAIFVIQKKTEYIAAPHALIYFGVVLFFIYFKLSSLVLGIHDPFVPFENLFCMIFMGGIWDSLGRAFKRKGDVAAQGDTNKSEGAKKKD